MDQTTLVSAMDGASSSLVDPAARVRATLWRRRYQPPPRPPGSGALACPTESAPDTEESRLSWSKARTATGATP
ncbi:hypothetical protein GCM10026982_22170 [Nocardiopsis aegyptia]